jgi:hypothetical protein
MPGQLHRCGSERQQAIQKNCGLEQRDDITFANEATAIVEGTILENNACESMWLMWRDLLDQNHGKDHHRY